MSFLITIFLVSMCDVRHYSGISLTGMFRRVFEVIADQPFGRESIEKHGVISNVNVILLIEV
jgi:hypothetical protein